MIAVSRFTVLAWTWYVLAGTIVTFAVGTIASELVTRRSNNVASGMPD
jgi:hypothetical protein